MTKVCDKIHVTQKSPEYDVWVSKALNIDGGRVGKEQLRPCVSSASLPCQPRLPRTWCGQHPVTAKKVKPPPLRQSRIRSDRLLRIDVPFSGFDKLIFARRDSQISSQFTSSNGTRKGRMMSEYSTQGIMHGPNVVFPHWKKSESTWKGIREAVPSSVYGSSAQV